VLPGAINNFGANNEVTLENHPGWIDLSRPSRTSAIEIPYCDQPGDPDPAWTYVELYSFQEDAAHELGAGYINPSRNH
jgi:hypothetical protein